MTRVRKATKKGPTAISAGVIEDVFNEQAPFTSRQGLYDALYEACPFDNAAHRSVYLKRINLVVEEWEAVRAWNKKQIGDG